MWLTKRQISPVEEHHMFQLDFFPCNYSFWKENSMINQLYYYFRPIYCNLLAQKERQPMLETFPFQHPFHKHLADLIFLWNFSISHFLTARILISNTSSSFMVQLIISSQIRKDQINEMWNLWRDNAYSLMAVERINYIRA